MAAPARRRGLGKAQERSVIGEQTAGHQHKGNRMGLFWDLIQQSQISEQRSRATSLEDRVRQLEGELLQTKQAIRNLLEILEKHFGEDINRDGKIG